MQRELPHKTTTPLWRDERFLHVIGQIVFLLAVGFFAYLILQNMQVGLRRQGMVLGLSFLQGISGFDIGGTLIEYSRSSTYWQAYTVGLLNTLAVSFVGIIFSTIFGVWLGVARLSKNFIISRLAAFYLELIRNLPLLVFLIFWYLGVFLKLPRVRNATVWPGSIYLTNRGVGIPWGLPTESFPTFQWILLLGLILALVVFITLRAYARRTGRAPLIKPSSRIH